MRSSTTANQPPDPLTKPGLIKRNQIIWTSKRAPVKLYAYATDDPVNRVHITTARDIAAPLP